MSGDDRDDPTAPVETDALASPAEDAGVFWRTYSPRFEMPISAVLSALALGLAVLLFAGLAFLSMSCSGSGAYTPGPVIGTTDGDDAFGAGESGGGGEPDPTIVGNSPPSRDDIKDVVQDLETLESVKVDLNKQFQLEDPNSVIPISDGKVAPYAALDQQIRDKMLGRKKGDGTTGNGGEGNNPNGKGDGTGSDSTRARTLRWVIAFKTAGGRDYLDQLKSLGAKVVVPTADGRGMILFRNLDGNPPQGKLMGDSDWNELSGLVQFADYTNLTREQVGPALGMGKLPKGFWAFFPKEVEKELARKEVGFQQRRSEDIEETKFECVNRGGKYELIVTRQTLKK